MKHPFALLFTGFLCLTNTIEAAASQSDMITKALPDSELNISLLDISAAPSSIVGGAVNVITGSYVESDYDLVIPGAVPLTVKRHFNSGSRERGSLCHGWDLNLPSYIKVFSSEETRYPITALVNDRGSSLVFEGHCRKDMKIRNGHLKYLNSRKNYN